MHTFYLQVILAPLFNCSLSRFPIPVIGSIIHFSNDAPVISFLLCLTSPFHFLLRASWDHILSKSLALIFCLRVCFWGSPTQETSMARDGDNWSGFCRHEQDLLRSLKTGYLRKDQIASRINMSQLYSVIDLLMKSQASSCVK